METMIIDGKKLAEEAARRLTPSITSLAKLTLAVIMVGDNPVSARYVRSKEKLGQSLGVEVRVFQYDSSIERDELVREIERLNNDAAIDGIILQLPLPIGLDTDSCITAISPDKDVDALSAEAVVPSPVSLAVDEILDAAGVDASGKKAAVIGAGRLVGRPVAMGLIARGADVKIVLSAEKERDVIRNADIIVSGVGKAGLIRPEDIKEGAILIDAATSEDGGRLRGDAQPACAGRCSVFTPVPGGVGPITLVKLFENLVSLRQRR